MSVTYSQTAINARLQGVADTIDANGAGVISLIAQGGTVLSRMVLAQPCGVVDFGILTFSGQLFDDSAAATGVAAYGIIQDGIGTTVVSNLNVGIPLSGADIILSNGLNSTAISSGQVLELLTAQIIGS